MIQSSELNRRHLVLVVEDQEINRDILGMILEDEYDLIYAENGAIGMEMIRENKDQLSIILLDLIMPVMDGFEVLRQLHDDTELREIPVIVLTAEKEAELKALQLGASDFITKPFDMDQVVLARVERIIELSERRQLIRSAERDPLTGLYTKGFFFEYADQIVKFHPDWKMDAIVINIERFHSVNEYSGREFGDKVLRKLADGIREFLKDTTGIASRIEADRFDIFCLHRDSSDYREVYDSLQSKLDEMSEKTNIRIRMGVKPYRDGVTPSEMFDRARVACNMVRGSNKDHMMIFDEDMRQMEMFQQRLMNDLGWAIEDKQFVVYYQPKYDIQAEPPKLKSAEALVRWKHPELGMISPGDFIPLFENNGMISQVDNYVWAVAARQIAEWRDKLGYLLPLSVNLSRAEIFDPKLEPYLEELLEENDLSTKELKLEVTESAYTDNAMELIDIIGELRKMGFEIEMDDFGSGYSSLNMLSSMPIDVLKMDMKFIRNLEEDIKNFRMIELILDIAKFLEVPVVAEGVETEEQMKLLKDAKCALVQGYYFSRPLPAEEFEALIIKEMNIDRNH
ncbi:MAG: EAL domain-containing protein [Mogibacterium sp.]|nr:EAL domain-containing protein [Mogibacterium sp.]